MRLSGSKLAFILLIMLAAALACGDADQGSLLGPPDPPGPAAQQPPQPDFSLNEVPGTAPPDPIPNPLVHTRRAYEAVSLDIARDDFPTGISQPTIPTVLRVPKFDPNLGELLEARLIIVGGLASEMLSHGRAPTYVSSEYNLHFSALVQPDEVIGNLIGRDRIGFTHNYDGSAEDWGVTAEVSRRRDKQGSYEFDEVFVGADAQVFVAENPGEQLTFDGHHSVQLLPNGQGKLLHTFANHKGLSLDNFLEIQDEPDGTSGGAPCDTSRCVITTLAPIVATLINDSDGHGVFAYSDLHAAAVARFDVKVTYLYEPNRPPDCSAAAPSMDALWPVNNKLTPIDVLGVTDLDGDPFTINIDAIFQDEPTDTGDSKFATDGQGVGSSTAEVRAERVDSGNGRVYHISFTAEDDKGASCSSEWVSPFAMSTRTTGSSR